MKSNNSTLKTAVVCAAIGWTAWTAGNVCRAQANGNPGLSPDLQEVVKLSQARMPDDVVKNYIISSGKTYRLSADDIVYLNGQGVSPSVISALQTAAAANASPVPPGPVSAPMPPPPPPQAYNNVPQPDTGAAPPDVQPTPPPPPEVNYDYFHDQLAPYGSWVNVGGVMYWHPDQALAVNPDWRPYYDMGQWAQTDNGLYWQSDYTWGDIPFHYGRWVLNPGMGWLWTPDYTWGPAWVFWRQDEGDNCIGWAPLPVGALFVNGAFMFNGVVVGADFDFGLHDSCFTFVGYDHFHEGFFRMRGHEWAHNIDREHLHTFYARSVIRNDFRRDEHGRFVNNGIGRDRIEHLTHVEHANFEERNPVGDRNRLATTRAEDHRQVTGGQAGHGSTGGFDNDRGAKTGAGNNYTHDQNSGADRNIRTTGENNNNSNMHGQGTGGERTMSSSSSVSKVYRPPSGGGGVGGGGQPRTSSGGGSSGGGQSQNKKK